MTFSLQAYECVLLHSVYAARNAIEQQEDASVTHYSMFPAWSSSPNRVQLSVENARESSRAGIDVFDAVTSSGCWESAVCYYCYSYSYSYSYDYCCCCYWSTASFFYLPIVERSAPAAEYHTWADSFWFSHQQLWLSSIVVSSQQYSVYFKLMDSLLHSPIMTSSFEAQEAQKAQACLLWNQ